MHGAIVVPMALHALFAAVVVLWNRHYSGLGLSGVSNSIVGSLSIVVGLMLVSLAFFYLSPVRFYRRVLRWYCLQAQFIIAVFQQKNNPLFISVQFTV